MGAHLNPLEKEFLIKRYLSRKGADIKEFCEVNDVTVQAFKKWLKQYSEGGIEALVSAKAKDGGLQVLPEGMDPTVENCKREILKLRIENERLKKNYTVETTPDGGRVFRRLREKNTK